MGKIDWSKAPHWADRVVRSPRKLKMFWANDDERQTLDGSRYGVNTQHVRDNWEVVSRRPVFVPGKPLVTFSWSCNAEPAPITIEQRIASLRALEKRIEETRAELTRDLESLGLTWMVRGEPTITVWRDLRVGDVIAFDGVEGECVVVSFPNLENRPISARKLNADCHLIRPDINVQPFRFIRRP